MPPSQIEQHQELTLGHGYTHKKFNCGYSHKKLGLRLRQREPENIKTFTQSEMEQVEIKKPKDIFRPYALDDGGNTPRKRKTSKSLNSAEENCTTPVNSAQISAFSPQYQLQQQINTFNFASPTPCLTTTTSYEAFASSALGSSSYNTHLQKDYMDYLAYIQHYNLAATLQTASGYPIGYPNITASMFNRC